MSSNDKRGKKNDCYIQECKGDGVEITLLLLGSKCYLIYGR